MSQPARRPRWMLLGFGILLALLVSLPVIAVATGALEGSPQYVLMADVPERGDGAYLKVDDGTRAGVVKLYPWNFQLNAFPADAPVFNPRHVRGMVVSQRGLDDPARYNLFRLNDGAMVEFETTSTPTKVFFTPRAALAEGDYMLDMPKSGLSSDRQYLYFRLSAAQARLPVP